MAFRSIRRIWAAPFFLIPGLALAAPQPQARAFVSGKKGVDSAICGRKAPCRTFERAISLTCPGAEVVVLDSNAPIDAAISECSFTGHGAGVIGVVADITLDRSVVANIGSGGQDDVEIARGLLFLTNDAIPNAYRGVVIAGDASACALGNNFIANVRGTIDHCPLQ
jgi:hypothetical protein